VTFNRLAAATCVRCFCFTSCNTRSRSRSRWLKAIRSVSMGPSATHESGHFYFAQTGHSHFAATDGKLRLAGKIDWWENARIMTRKRPAVLLFLVCAAAPLWTSSAVAQETLRYVIVSNGKTQGSEVDTFGSDGRIDSSFEF